MGKRKLVQKLVKGTQLIKESYFCTSGAPISLKIKCLINQFDDLEITWQLIRTHFCLSCNWFIFLTFVAFRIFINMRVVVIGAGISGATSAFRIKRKYPEAEIKIVYAESSPNTTSDIAAGWWVWMDLLIHMMFVVTRWEPHLDPDTDLGLVTKWSGDTYDMLATLCRGDTVKEMGDTMSDAMRSVIIIMIRVITTITMVSKWWYLK